MTTRTQPAPKPLDFATWLSSLSDSQLHTILSNRMDVCHPAPPGISSLAARLQLRASLGRAVVKLSARHIAVVEVLARLGGEIEPVANPDVCALLGEFMDNSDPKDIARTVDDVLEDLSRNALVFPSAAGWQIAPEVMQAFPPSFQLLPDPEVPTGAALEALIAGLEDKHRKILLTLQHSGGVGTTRDAAIDADPTRPIPQLIAQSLLLRVDSTTVRLPMAVRRALTGDHAAVLPLTNPVDSLSNKEAQVEENETQRAAGTALEVVRLVRSLVEFVESSPLLLLKEATVGVRSLQSLVKALDCDELTALRVLGLGMAMGVVARGVPDDDTGLGDQVLASTQLAEEFLESPVHEQWAFMVEQWWNNGTFAPWLVGSTDEAGKPLRALSAATVVEKLPKTRSLVLSGFENGALSFEQLRSVLGYCYPLHMVQLSASLVSQLVQEAVFVGLVVQRGELFVPTQLLLELLCGHDIRPFTLAAAPHEVEYVIPQGDMTVLAPGPLTPKVHSQLRVIADVESQGVACVYRISEASIRRAFDAGWSKADFVAFFANHSVGQIPQTVEFLVDDVARQHGQLRGGIALCYVRSEDPALLLEASRCAAAAEIGLRVIAPTVAVCQVPLGRACEVLRDAGIHVVAEDDAGVRVDVRPKPIRVAVPVVKSPAPRGCDDEALVRAMSAIRGADAAALVAKTGVKAQVQAGASISVINAAIRARRKITIGFVDRQGAATQIVVTPITVAAGVVSAVDETTGQLHQFPLHRVTQVVVEAGVE
ncbi:MAG: helicase-associated domain-containing protein [Corynebacterium sp.]|uniref:helicase-associated domain-containing protein n=1 Tax=Corynebacterium sp. TaxID=1720 RepID=UPI0026DA9AF0|nr:helicase-associated domain-containing protein [Corynebacterium sp.]MDO4762005.1 helicase-associated domain-containing protein [Corynebacterium sp.]